MCPKKSIGNEILSAGTVNPLQNVYILYVDINERKLNNSDCPIYQLQHSFSVSEKVIQNGLEVELLLN